MDGEVIQIDFERTGTWPVKAKGRHHGWLGSLSITCCSSALLQLGELGDSRLKHQPLTEN